MQIRLACSVLSVLSVAGCATPPEGTTQEDIQRFEAAVASIGCDLVTEADYLPVELQAGISREQSTSLAAFVLATERAVKLEDGGIRLVKGPCEA
ncbi:MAG: hypothetical protein AAGF53_07805 [Pseudomonadota bacterium]